mmetsp:Transcript_96237/g.206554  ORF Transcript_96237/g.206554 Transcript_96237/m.206554 type:complete len:229 (+) Transcript_96237:406-1092(+)
MGSTIMPTFSRRAAIAFSLMPPTRSTLPVNVSSPVIAKSFFTGRSSAMLSNAEVIATPAEGPSFGVAPSGMFMCMAASSRKSFGSSTSRRNKRAYERAISLDSLITLPSFPVTLMRAPPEGRRFRGSLSPASWLSVALSEALLPRASTNSVLPPRAVQARPITTPGGIPSGKIWSEVCGGWPTNFLRLSSVMAERSRFSSSTRTRLRATFRAIFSRSFRSSRTPASRA